MTYGNQRQSWAGSRVCDRSALAEALRYIIKRRTALTRSLTDAWLGADNNIAENAIRCIALGRRNWLFAGSNSGGGYIASWHEDEHVDVGASIQRPFEITPPRHVARRVDIAPPELVAHRQGRANGAVTDPSRGAQTGWPGNKTPRRSSARPE